MLHMRMKYFQVLSSCRSGLSKLLLEQLYQSIQHRVYISTSSLCSVRKKNSSHYEQVHTERYASLVRSIISAEARLKTSDADFRKNKLLNGPFSRSASKSPEEEDLEGQEPKNMVPFINPKKVSEPTLEKKLKFPLRAKLHMSNSRTPFPSVTYILRQTMPIEQSYFLEKWKRRMIVELGEEGFREYSAGILLHGKHFHTALEAALLDTQSTVQEDSGFIKSVQHVLEDISGVRALESAVHHSDLQYLGLVDCVAEYQGKLCVIEWKTSEKPKPFLKNTYDYPLQVAAYVGALNYDSNYNYQVSKGWSWTNCSCIQRWLPCTSTFYGP
ncbi:mitochondrial genome maintenance exonuclease 1 isoform X2 [Protopterus annectens]|uniref:mitochondrial genome maintenance exonuclease 1 isoform X2 n=1 Tax=Protopterus annectens TaxID=7888 RepID=UPI001CFA72C9|nr:mitochondrial genome maintenance exonuclease 1 isoform X2 [Protopterus annectens]